MAQDHDYSIISDDQSIAVLDNAPVAVYVSALDSFELLYANSLSKQLMKGECRRGLACYQALGFSEPCPFCQTHNMSRTKLLIRQFKHPKTKRIYQLSGKIIDWSGRPAHIEYILDITEAQEKEERSKAISEELQATFSSIPCGLCVYQFDGLRISPLFHNPAFYQIMGYDQAHIQQVERDTNYLGVHPDDLAALQGKIQKVLCGGGSVRHVYRVWNDAKQEYRWIHLEGSVKPQEDGSLLLYAVYNDVSEQQRLEHELIAANEKMQDVIHAIPGGVAIFQITNADTFETVYISDGVPELSGHTAQEYQELMKSAPEKVTYREDLSKVAARLRKVIKNRGVSTFEYRKQHRDGHIVWVRAQMKWIGESENGAIIHCVLHNITEQKETQLELEHMLNSIPGGIASYRIENGKFIPVFYSDGVLTLSGHSREEFEEITRDDAFAMIHESDRERVQAALQSALENGNVLDISYRIRCKNGSLIWVHLNGRRMDPVGEGMRFYAVFTGMSAETKLFQSIANETADAIYVIAKKNYDLLYVNEAKELFDKREDGVGRKCYEALHGKDAPCEFCTLTSHRADGKEHDMMVSGSGRFYRTCFRETDWNGIPAFVKYVQDVTEEVQARREKQRLEEYFQTVIKNLSGGIAVVRYRKDGSMKPEFLSDGFAEMTGMTMEEAWKLYQQDAMEGVHPDDRESVAEQILTFINSREGSCKIAYRLKKGDGSYIWVKTSLSVLESANGEIRVYAGYQDITKERQEQEQLRQQYNELIVQHYKASAPNELIMGHCNVTQNRILEIVDHTDSSLLQTFGSVREEFFTGIASLIVDEDERQAFLAAYLNQPSLDAFYRGDTEIIQNCFVKLPKATQGNYVQFKVNLVETPDTGDITGILTVTDITEQTISNRILQQLSVASYDLVVDIDLFNDRSIVITENRTSGDDPIPQNRHSENLEYMLKRQVLPKDRERAGRMLDSAYMLERLKKDGSYSFSYSIMGKKGDILTKNLTISAADLRLGRICLARTDITDSVREQQGLLNVIAYTFELLVSINVSADRFTLHTRQTVLENLPPFIVDNYSQSPECLSVVYGPDMEHVLEERFQIETVLRRLEENPAGYDFVVPYQGDDGTRYKQINVLWGDEDHKIVCMVRADVTDMLAAERQTKDALEKALEVAEKANRAKSDFLSSMSHDIRTPMNAITGMTTLAMNHLDDRERIAGYLQKIALSSRHLLSLINDILDMNKIERSKITLNCVKIALPELVEQLSDIMTPQAKESGLQFAVRTEAVTHKRFYGDSLRINQILINILSNAIKFTPEGGRVEFRIEEIPALRDEGTVRYRFTVSDTGIGMSEDFLAHLFKPFTRSRNVTRVEGSGLGLSIAKELVELMGGSISVESRLHQGTTFRVELECKAAREEDGDRMASKEDSQALSNEKVLMGRRFLVAEDNAINAEILCELLDLYGAKTVVKTDGAQAVQEFKNTNPGTYDAILMDIQMPKMNGYDATRAIRRLNREDAKNIPIVAMSANAFTEDIDEARKAGMDAHVAKPIDIKVLWTTLGRILGNTNKE